jgi:hypothetical protein
MQADMDEDVYMKLEGTMAELLVPIAPKIYRKYMHLVNGRTILY